MARLRYHWTSLVSFREWREKQIPSAIISQATKRCSSRSVVQYSTTEYSELIWVYSKKSTNCFTGKWWPNSILTKKYVSFMTVSVILSIPCASTWCILTLIDINYISYKELWNCKTYVLARQLFLWKSLWEYLGKKAEHFGVVGNNTFLMYVVYVTSLSKIVCSLLYHV
jgi:hypothetical protein